MEFKVTIKKKGPVFDGSATKVVDRKLEDAMYEATQLLEREVKERTPRGVMGAQGGLLSTIHGEVLKKGTSVVKGVVGSSAEYAEVIEKGRRAGKKWPPEGALIRWIEVKLKVGREMAERLEFVIRRKIGRKGFPGVHMFEKALDENWHRIQKIFDRAGYEITRVIDGE